MDRYDIEDEDDTDIIQDGQALRVSLRMMDSLQRDIAGIRTLHQPGFASDAQPVFDEEVAYDAAERRDFAKAELSAAWKGGLEAGDVIRLGDRDVVVGDRNPQSGRLRLYDVGDCEDAETLRQQAYDAYDEEVSNAWRTDE